MLFFVDYILHLMYVLIAFLSIVFVFGVIPYAASLIHEEFAVKHHGRHTSKHWSGRNDIAHHRRVGHGWR